MKKTLHLLLTLALFVCNIALYADGDEFFSGQVTIGTESNLDNTPFNTQHCYSWNETIYPGTEIGGECTIHAISYHSTVENTPYPINLDKLEIYMAVTEKFAFSSAIDWIPTQSLIKVYSGTNVTIGDTPWEKITLDVPFYYNGKGNLVVVVAKKTYGYNSKLKWHYTKDTYTSTLYYSNDGNESIADVPPTTANSGNRMTYRANIMMDVVYGEVSTPIVVSPNPIDFGMRPTGAWTRPVTVDMTTDSLPASILSIKSSNKYFILSNYESPINVTTENPFSMKIKNSDSNVIGEMKGQFTVVSNYGESVVDMKAVTYAPESPDVWEKAEVVTSYPYLSTPDFDKIYNNYYLPGNTQDGPDAVYKLTVTEPTTLAVGVNGANAKMALYPEGFNGKGGPDVDNNYGATIDPDQQEPEFPEVEMPEVQGNSFSFDFNDGKMDGWRTIDIDGDNFNWEVITSGAGTGVKCLVSRSMNTGSLGGAKLNPDNYIVTQGSYAIDKNSVLEFDIKATEEYLDDKYAVVVSLDGINFETLEKSTFFDANWNHITVSLAEYAGKNVVVGLRHFEAGTRSFAIYVDNVQLTPGRGSRYVKSEKYTVPAGTYYLAVSATERFSVNINATTETGYNPITEVVAKEDNDNVNLIWSFDFINNAVELSNNKISKTRTEEQKKTVLGYNVYRRNTLEDKAAELIAENLTDTTYTDAAWNTMEMGLYQWGVSVIYDAGNGAEYETEVAYSNTVGKDMFTKLNIVVATEKGASPAGTTVSLYNVYEPSFRYEVTLDETGTYTIDSFRRGTYRYSMSLDGYKPGPNNVEMEVWNETELKYTFEEIFVLGDIFVSSTGWAMWKDILDEAESYTIMLDGEVVESEEPWNNYYQFNVTNLVEGQEYVTTVIGDDASEKLEYTWTYRPCDDLVQATDFEVEVDGKDISLYWTLPVKDFVEKPTEFMFDFEDETLNGWIAIDADKDGYTWSNSSEYVEEGGYQSFSSAMSHSSLSTKALNPDNYLATSRKYLITDNSQLRFMVSAENKDFAAEHYGIAVSTKSNYNVGDFEMVWNETLPQDDNSTTAHGTWYVKTVDLSKYAGQEVYIAFRHYDCTNQSWINIDKVELTTAETRKQNAEWLYYENGISADALGLQGGATVYWGILFPAADMQKYAGQSLTKVSMFDFSAHEGRFMIYLGGDKAPGTLVHTQNYKGEGSKEYMEYELTNPVEITGEQNVWVVFNNFTGQYVASSCFGGTEPNGRWFSTDGVKWNDVLVSAGLNLTWQIRAYVEEKLIANSTDYDVLGAMLYRDGKLLTEQPVAGNSFTEILSEYGEYEYSMRVVYGGEEETYYAMSCPQTLTLNHVIKCKAPNSFHAEPAVNADGTFGTRMEWPYTLHGTDWLYYDNGVNESALGLQGSTVYWGIMFPSEKLEYYNGTLLTKVALYDYVSHEGTINIYYAGDDAPELMIHSQPYSTKGTKKYVEFELTAPIPVDASVNLWVVFHNTNGDWVAPICENTGDKNGRWMSTDGENWADIGTTEMSGTFMVRAFVESMRGERALGERNEDATFSHYNVYRGTSLDDMEVIAQPTAGYYFDEVEKGTYYYQVTATYFEGDIECESDFTKSYFQPENKYILVDVDAIEENGVGNIKLYPNPTNGDLNISAEGMQRITVINTLGQVVYDQNANSDNEVVDMSRFDAGIYMVRIMTDNGMTTQRVSVIR